MKPRPFDPDRPLERALDGGEALDLARDLAGPLHDANLRLELQVPRPEHARERRSRAPGRSSLDIGEAGRPPELGQEGPVLAVGLAKLDELEEHQRPRSEGENAQDGQHRLGDRPGGSERLQDFVHGEILRGGRPGTKRLHAVDDHRARQQVVQRLAVAA